MIQAAPNKRVNIETLKSVMVRNGSEMAPITQFVTLKRIYGPDNISRFNMYPLVLMAILLMVIHLGKLCRLFKKLQINIYP